MIENVNDFKKALEFVLRWEGGYVNDPSDPGGETKFGISKKSYPELDIKNLTPEDALNIYKEDFWIACGCESIPFPFNIAVFDTAVNCGTGRAISWCRSSNTVYEFLNRRRLHYLTLINKNPALKRFERGWMNRLNDLTKFVELNDPDLISPLL